MKNIAVFYGGKSVEHDISVITAMQVISFIPKEYKIYPIYITPNGEFVIAKNLTDVNIYLNFTKNAKKLRKITLNLGKNEIFVLKNNKIKEKIKVDCALLCNHGHGGEDGSLQGLLELCEIPYSSPSLPASAITMDKALTKAFLLSEHIDTPAYVQFSGIKYKKDFKKILEKISNKISFPCIVKPARLGSSVGINICSSEDMLIKSIDEALEFDDKIIVEKFVKDAREFCCAAIKADNKIYLSKVIEVKKGEFYTFEEKYLESKQTDELKIEDNLKSRIENLTRKVYETLELDGVVRIDFLYDVVKNKLYVNEPNSIPGSLAFNMFDTNFADLLNLIINTSIKNNEKRKKICYSFNSDAIKNFIEMSASQKSSK